MHEHSKAWTKWPQISSQRYFKTQIVLNTQCHFLNQCHYSIINWTLRNNIQCIFNQNISSIQENAFKDAVWKMWTNSSLPQRVNTSSLLLTSLIIMEQKVLEINKIVNGLLTHYRSIMVLIFNSSPPGQDGRHFADNIFRCIYANENFCILINISLKFVPKWSIDIKSALVQVMAWRWIGDKPLSAPMLTQFPDAYMQHQGEMS